MLSHVYISVKDFPQAMALYQPLLAGLHQQLRRLDTQRPWAVWSSPGDVRPFLVIGLPYGGRAHDAGVGQMVALMAQTRTQVDSAHALAMSLGCEDEGAPGLRPHYHEHYYGAYFRDPSGNKLCVVCHSPTGAQTD